MIRNSKEKEISPKQEGTTNDDKINKGPSTSRQWSGLKDPRIVRVSRTFGGKDRHSKVTTIRGLRDRRVRLSVPTAIQLYDLQDRLGLNQPSKVVDWLLNAAQHAIDELPPLQVPPENFVQYPQSMVISHEVTPPQIPPPSYMAAYSNYVGDNGAHSLTLLSSEGKFKENKIFIGDDQTRSTNFTLWNADASLRAKHKEVTREIIRRNEQVNQENTQVHSVGLSTHGPLPRPIHSSFSGLLNNVMPHPSYYHWEPPNAYLSHSGTHGYSWQMEQLHNNNAILLPPALSLSSGSQLLLCPSGTMPPIFPSHVSTQVEDDPKLIHQSQILSSSSQSLLPSSLTTSLYSISPTMRPFQVNITPMHHHSQNNLESHSNTLSKGSGGPSSALSTSLSQNDSKATLGSNPSSFM